MKRFLAIILLFCYSTSFSQDSTTENVNRHILGIFASPLANTIWYTGYYTHPDNQPTGYKISFTYFNPTGISYQYNIHNTFRLQIGLFSTLENYQIERLHLNTNLYKRVDYKVDYLNIPLSVKCFPFHLTEHQTINPSHYAQSDALGGFFIQVGANFDFITKERITSSEYYSYSPSSGGGGFAFPPEVSNRSIIRFNRICPTLAIGHEIVGDKISFFYGGSIQFQSIYQEYNTLEYFKNTKFSLINVGLNYHF